MRKIPTIYRNNRRQNNTSGKVGVCKSKQIYTNVNGDKIHYFAWKVSWVENGKHKGKVFSWKKYGKTKALNLAIQFRQKLEYTL